VDAKGDPDKKNYEPAHYEIGGDLLSLNMKYTTCTGTDCNGGDGGGGGGGAGGGGSVPEPATLALVSLALLSAGQARRLQRSRG
jgi:hypothetical protein